MVTLEKIWTREIPFLGRLPSRFDLGPRMRRFLATELTPLGPQNPSLCYFQVVSSPKWFSSCKRRFKEARHSEKVSPPKSGTSVSAPRPICAQTVGSTHDDDSGLG